METVLPVEFLTENEKVYCLRRPEGFFGRAIFFENEVVQADVDGRPTTPGYAVVVLPSRS